MHATRSPALHLAASHTPSTPAHCSTPPAATPPSTHGPCSMHCMPLPRSSLRQGCSMTRMSCFVCSPTRCRGRLCRQRCVASDVHQGCSAIKEHPTGCRQRHPALCSNHPRPRHPRLWLCLRHHVYLRAVPNHNHRGRTAHPPQPGAHADTGIQQGVLRVYQHCALSATRHHKQAACKGSWADGLSSAPASSRRARAVGSRLWRTACSADCAGSLACSSSTSTAFGCAPHPHAPSTACAVHRCLTGSPGRRWTVGVRQSARRHPHPAPPGPGGPRLALYLGARRLPAQHPGATPGTTFPDAKQPPEAAPHVCTGAAAAHGAVLAVHAARGPQADAAQPGGVGAGRAVGTRRGEGPWHGCSGGRAAASGASYRACHVYHAYCACDVGVSSSTRTKMHMAITRRCSRACRATHQSPLPPPTHQSLHRLHTHQR